MVPVAISYFLKKSNFCIIDCSVTAKKLVSSAYWDNFKDYFWFGMGYPTTFLLALMLGFIISLLIIYKRRDRGHPCLTPLVSGKGEDRNPLLDIIDSIFC